MTYLGHCSMPLQSRYLSVWICATHRHPEVLLRNYGRDVTPPPQKSRARLLGRVLAHASYLSGIYNTQVFPEYSLLLIVPVSRRLNIIALAAYIF